MNNDEYTIEKYNIGDLTSYRLKDTNGEYWYPLKLFHKDMLLGRKCHIERFRDNDVYRKHMKVIKYLNPKSVSNNEVKTWFINTEGIYLLLQNITLLAKNKYSNKVYLRKSELLALVRNYFGVVSPNSEEYIGYKPDISNYDVWSILCIKYDFDIDERTIWKKCSECGYYYPYTKKYYEKTGEYLKRKCKQCTGVRFRCDNKKLQFLYTHNGFDLIYKVYMNDDSEKIADELRRWLL